MGIDSSHCFNDQPVLSGVQSESRRLHHPEYYEMVEAREDKAQQLKLKIAAMEAELEALGEQAKEPMAQLSIQVPQSVKIAIERIAKEKGSNMNAYCRRLITAHVAENSLS